MEIHEVKSIALEEKSTFKGTPIRYEAEYFYCDNTEEIYSNEEMLKKNDIAMKDAYRKAIEAKYARIESKREYNGDANLNLDKVIDVIRYYASSTAVKGLYKVKLMKMLWYGDNLAYKQRDHAITGLAYQALPMGAVPIGHDLIIELKEVPCEEIEMGDGTAYRFKLSTPCVFAALTEEEKEILDKVIKRVGRMTSEEIVNFMHQEEAYKKTKLKDMIDFKYAKELQL